MKLALRLAVLVLCLVPLAPTALAQPDPQPQGVLGSPAFEVEPAKTPETDAEIRQWYLNEVATIPSLNAQWLAAGLNAEQRARRAYTVRRDARLKARSFMQSRVAVIALRARDVIKYGNPDGPTFEYLVTKNKAKGLEGDAIYEAIVGSAQRTNRAADERH